MAARHIRHYTMRHVTFYMAATTGCAMSRATSWCAWRPPCARMCGAGRHADLRMAAATRTVAWCGTRCTVWQPPYKQRHAPHHAPCCRLTFYVVVRDWADFAWRLPPRLYLPNLISLSSHSFRSSPSLFLSLSPPLIHVWDSNWNVSGF